MLHLKVILPVDIDVSMTGGPQVHEVFIFHYLLLVLKLLQNFFHVHCVPNNDRICDQVEAAYLVAKLLIRLSPNFTLIGIEKVRPQAMQGFPLVQLSIDSATIGFVCVPS